MVVFDPCGDVGIAVKLESFAGFPTRIEDAKINMRADGGLAGPTSEPGPHVPRGADRSFLVEHRNNGERVFKADGFPEVLNDLGHVECVKDAAADFVLAEQLR